MIIICLSTGRSALTLTWKDAGSTRTCLTKVTSVNSNTWGSTCLKHRIHEGWKWDFLLLGSFVTGGGGIYHKLLMSQADFRKGEID